MNFSYKTRLKNVKTLYIRGGYNDIQVSGQPFVIFQCFLFAEEPKGERLNRIRKKIVLDLRTIRSERESSQTK